MCEIFKKPIFTKSKEPEKNPKTSKHFISLLNLRFSGEDFVHIFRWSSRVRPNFNSSFCDDLVDRKKPMKPVIGTVVSNKMQKSVVVAVDRLFHNKLYNRYVKRTSKFMAHDDKDACNIGDRVILSHLLLPYQSNFVSLRLLNLSHLNRLVIELEALEIWNFG